VKATKAENVARLQAKTSELLEWFEGKDIPAAPFLLSQGETCINPEKMVLSALNVLDTYAENPFSKPFVSAYLRLNNLKIYIERANIKQSGGKRKKLPKSSIAGN
jgi:hypothetical protein